MFLNFVRDRFDEVVGFCERDFFVRYLSLPFEDVEGKGLTDLVEKRIVRIRGVGVSRCVFVGIESGQCECLGVDCGTFDPVLSVLFDYGRVLCDKTG